MKTPREILLGRHQAAEPNLDRMRKEIVAWRATLRGGRLGDTDAMVRSSVQSPRVSAVNAIAGKLWRELIVPLRWHFAAMSAVWVVLAVLTADQSPVPSPVVAERDTPSSRQILIALQENRRLLLEMIESPAVKLPSAPLPRSERQLCNAVV